MKSKKLAFNKEKVVSLSQKVMTNVKGGNYPMYDADGQQVGEDQAMRGTGASTDKTFTCCWCGAANDTVFPGEDRD